MARMSRMTKYKDLREGIKTDVVTSDSASVYTGQEKQVRDADYYKRFLNSDQVSQLEKPDTEDTLLESLTLDSINSQVDEELERALSRVREEAGQEDFNTRMDILNKIRQTKMAQAAALTQEEVEEPEIEEEVELEEDDEEEEQASGYRFGLFKRRQEDDEIEDEQEDEQEDEEEEEEETSHRFRFGFKKRMAEVEEDEQEEELEEEEETPRKFRFGSKKRSSDIEEDELEEGEEEENSTFIKVLNGVIIVLSLVLVALVGYIIKEFIF
jgi:hypothetical protein